jgi:hypothetical protein
MHMNAKKHMNSIHLDEKYDGSTSIREFLKLDRENYSTRNTTH